MQGSKWAVVLLLLIGCDQPDVYIEDEFPDIVVEHVYHTTYVEDTTPDVCILEDNTPDVIYVTEEDTTPDIVQEFYGDTADLPVLLWTKIGETPMPKKLTQLDAATAVSDADQLLIEQSGTSKRVTRGLLVPLPTNYIGGLITANSTVDSLKDIDVAPGQARDDTDADNMRLASLITKQLDAIWAVGTNQGGLDTGSIATNTVYAIWLIKRSDTGVVDVLFSTSFTSPSMPTNYDRKRLIGAIVTNLVPDIEQYIQIDDYFRLLAPPLDVNDSAITDGTFATGTLRAAPKSLADIYATLSNPTTTSGLGILTIRPKTGTEPSKTNDYAYVVSESGSTFDVIGRGGSVLLDSNRQFEYAANEPDGSATVTVRTHGFRMLTRREP